MQEIADYIEEKYELLEHINVIKLDVYKTYFGEAFDADIISDVSTDAIAVITELSLKLDTKFPHNVFERCKKLFERFLTMAQNDSCIDIETTLEIDNFINLCQMYVKELIPYVKQAHNIMTLYKDKFSIITSLESNIKALRNISINFEILNLTIEYIVNMFRCDLTSDVEHFYELMYILKKHTKHITAKVVEYQTLYKI